MTREPEGEGITAKWMNALSHAGLQVVDYRGRLPEHASKRYQTRDVGRLVGVCWHHSAGSRTTEPAWEEMARYHVGPSHLSSTGAPGIAYTFGVDGAGRVYVFWDLETLTWSQKGGNVTHVGGVCLVSFKSVANAYGTQPTAAQRWAVRRVSLVTREVLGSTSRLWAAVHSDFRTTGCPGDNLRELVRFQLRSDARPYGSIVRRQQALVDVGHPVRVDGVWGPSSRRALEGFQAEAGLVVDGLWGPMTEAAVGARVVARVG